MLHPVGTGAHHVHARLPEKLYQASSWLEWIIVVATLCLFDGHHACNTADGTQPFLRVAAVMSFT